MKNLSATVVVSLGLVGGVAVPFAGAAAKEIHDEFYWLDRLNRASLVMMSEQKILDNTQTTTIAKALNRLREMSRDQILKGRPNGVPLSPI